MKIVEVEVEVEELVGIWGIVSSGFVVEGV